MSGTVDILRRLPGLTQTSEPVLAELARHFTPRTYKHELICKEGEPAGAVWVLASGEAEVVRTPRLGRRMTVAKLSPVSLFGHVSLFADTGRTASIYAAGRVEVLQISRTQVFLILRACPFEVASEFRQALIVAMSQQLAASTQALWRLAESVGVTEPADLEDRILAADSLV